MTRLVTVVAAVALAASCRGAHADGDAGKGTWTIDTSASSSSVAQGEKGRVAFAINCRDGVRVPAESPIRIELVSRGLRLDKTKLVNADAVDLESGNPRFDVPFVAAQKGAQTVEVALSFFVCLPKKCVPQKEKLSLKVDVR